jgi:hypothetical protein
MGSGICHSFITPLSLGLSHPLYIIKNNEDLSDLVRHRWEYWMEKMMVSASLHIIAHDETRDGSGREYIDHLNKLLQGSETLIQDQPAATIWLRHPHWPPKKILLILRGDRRDLDAVRWARLISCRSSSFITLLLVYPDVPGFYTRYPNVQLDLSILLNLQDGVGGLLCKAMEEFTQDHIPCQLRFHKAQPNDQIRTEVRREDYDLLIISRERHGWFWRSYFGELIRPLLTWIDRPVLVA